VGTHRGTQVLVREADTQEHPDLCRPTWGEGDVSILSPATAAQQELS
jgi:hypothetical protein